MMNLDNCAKMTKFDGGGGGVFVENAVEFYRRKDASGLKFACVFFYAWNKEGS